MLIQSSESDFTGFLGTQWSVPVNLSSGANHGFPRVAATLSGNTIYAGAVWISTNGSVNTILATTGTRSVVLPPTSLSVVQSSNNFGGVFTEYYNTVSWTASASPEIVSYVIYRNGAQIAQVDGSVTSFRDDNRVQSGAVTYGVAAVDNQSSQSTIPTVNYP